MGEEKQLSVIIPVYNTAPYLERCISSIRKQSYQTLEIICVDNNSTDDSLTLLRQFAAEDPRIVVLEQKKQGVSAARNMGIQHAHGEYITFVDSDDAIDPEMYQILVAILEKEQADVAHCGYRRFGIDGSFRDVSGTGEYLVETKWQAIEHLLNGEKYIGSLCNKIYKRASIDGLRMDENIAFNEDILLNFQLFNLAEKTVFLDEPLYWYHAREESATASSDREKKRRNTLLVSEKVWNLFHNSPVKESATNKYYYAIICLYREKILEKKSLSDEETRHYKELLKELESSGISISRRNRMDAKLMRNMPRLYRAAYSVYNKIRKPNWDVKQG